LNAASASERTLKYGTMVTQVSFVAMMSVPHFFESE
jgi:hypothetical protein